MEQGHCSTITRMHLELFVWSQQAGGGGEGGGGGRGRSRTCLLAKLREESTDK